MTEIEDSDSGPSKSDNNYTLKTQKASDLHENSYDEKTYEQFWSSVRTQFDSKEFDLDYVAGNIADVMCEEYDWIAQKDDKQKTLYVYHSDKGVYKPDGEDFLSTHMVNNANRQYYSDRKRNRVAEQIRPTNYEVANDIGRVKGKVCLENCVLDISTPNDPDPQPHSPKHSFTSRLPVEYDPEAECPNFEEYIKEVVPKEEDRKRLQEFAGYSLHHWDVPYNRSLLLLGPTQSGKSVFLNLMTNMLGRDNVLSETIQRLCNRDFAQVGLLDTIANINADLGTGQIKDTGAFKRMVAGDYMEIEPKFKGTIQIHPVQKHMYSANQVPEVPNADGAFYERWMFVKFPETISREDRNPHLKEQLLEEKSGILNWMLEGYARLMDQQQFTAERTREESKSLWKEYGDSLSRFIERSVVNAPNNEIEASMVHSMYKAEIRDNQSAKSQKELTTRLKKEFDINAPRKNENGIKHTVYQGIDLKPDEDGAEEVKI